MRRTPLDRTARLHALSVTCCSPFVECLCELFNLNFKTKEDILDSEN